MPAEEENTVFFRLFIPFPAEDSSVKRKPANQVETKW